MKSIFGWICVCGVLCQLGAYGQINPVFVALITSPTNNAQFAAPATILLKARVFGGGGGLKSLDFLANGQTIGKGELEQGPTDQFPPYVFEWTNVNAGAYTITTKAVDINDRVATSTSVHIVVTGKGPTNNQVIVTVRAVDATASERGANGQPDLGVFRVMRTGDLKTKLNVHYLLSGTAQNGADYENLSGTVTIPELKEGADVVVKPIPDNSKEGDETVILTLEQRVYIVPPPPEEQYLVGDPKAATVTIQDSAPANSAPTVRLTAPSANGSFVSPTNITITATASDSDGEVREVQFLANGKRIGSDTHAPYSIIWSNVPPGKYSIQAIATDNMGASATSAAVTITVKEGPKVTAERTLPASYSPGFPLKVALKVVPSATVGSYALEESLPKGWKPGADLGDGTYDKTTGKLKFGPFFDHQPSVIYYTVAPPANQTGEVEFHGTVSADGVNVRIGGDAHIRPAPRHPADTSPADNRMTIEELTAYAGAWKTGKRWPQAPAVIPVEYVTRASFLWKAGEAYHFDPTIKNAPEWWVSSAQETDPLPGPMPMPNPMPLPATLLDIGHHPAVHNAAGRSIQADPNGGWSINIQVVPAGGTKSYAIEEKMPEGWVVSSVSHDGNFDAQSGLIRWGLFVDALSRTVGYHLDALPGSSAGELGGTASFDGSNLSVTGPSRVSTSHSGSHSTIERHPGHGWHLQLNTEGPGTYRVEMSHDLQHWMEVGSGSTADGSLSWDDADWGPDGQRFYRAIRAD